MSATTSVVGLEEGLPPELELEAVEVGLVVVEHDEALGAKPLT